MSPYKRSRNRDGRGVPADDQRVHHYGTDDFPEDTTCQLSVVRFVCSFVAVVAITRVNPVV